MCIYLNKLLQINPIPLFPLLKWARMNDIRTGLINIVLFIKPCEANPIWEQMFSSLGLIKHYLMVEEAEGLPCFLCFGFVRGIEFIQRSLLC